MEIHSFGDRSHPPLVLLHGIGAGHRLWLRQIEYFARTHFVLAPDMPGLTAPAGARQPDISDIAGRLATQINALVTGPSTLCGISAGASVALALAARLGGGVSRLVLSAPQTRPPRFLLGVQIALCTLMPETALVAAAQREVRNDPEIAAAAAEDIRSLGKRGLLAAMGGLKVIR